MSIEIIKKHQQGHGAFDHGKIRENKPIGFPYEIGGSEPLSNLFYWAHAWSDTGGLIDTHPHQGFEIMSYVIEGQISHYDTKYNRWLSLSAGDAQVIRSGSGISHAERVLPGGKFFQIWFDPDLNKALRKDASYTDIQAENFPVQKNEYGVSKEIIGEKSPMALDSEGIRVWDMTEIHTGIYSMPLDIQSIYSIYVLRGEGALGEKRISIDDFIRVRDEEVLKIDFESEARLFIIMSPAKLSYATYAEQQLR